MCLKKLLNEKLTLRGREFFPIKLSVFTAGLLVAKYYPRILEYNTAIWIVFIVTMLWALSVWKRARK